MAEFITVDKLPPSFDVACTGDWHAGSKAFHEGALDNLIGWVLEKRHRYVGFTGDAVEGKPVGHKHFDPAGLDHKKLNIGDQFRYVTEKIRPIKDRILWWNLGNHDLYLSRDVDVVRQYVCEPLKIVHRLGGYQTWVDLRHFRVHVYHGRATMPKGAKDPVQKDANRRAWLVNLLSPLAGDCLVHLMGHTHEMLVQPPIEHYALLCHGKEVRARYFRQPTQGVDTDHMFIPPQSRWYANTGTLRRSGGFGWVDYAEWGGYAPSPIGWCQMVVRGGTVEAIEKVIV